MDLVAAKSRLEAIRSAAEQGDGRAMQEFFCYRFPHILNNGLYLEATERANELIESGRNPRDWSTYEEAGIATCLGNNLPTEQILTEDEFLAFQKKLIGDGTEASKNVEVLRVGHKDERTPDENLAARQAIREMRRSRHQPVDD
jgi:hypothetical protein